MWRIIVFLSCRANGIEITKRWPSNRSEQRQGWKIIRSSQSLTLTGFIKTIKGVTKCTVYVDMGCFANFLTISSEGAARSTVSTLLSPSPYSVMFFKEFWKYALLSIFLFPVKRPKSQCNSLKEIKIGPHKHKGNDLWLRWVVQGLAESRKSPGSFL